MNTRKRLVLFLQMHKIEKVTQSLACETHLSREMMLTAKEQALGITNDNSPVRRIAS